MTTEAAASSTDAATVARTYFEALGRRERNAPTEWYADDGVGRFYGLQDEPNPRAEVQQFFDELFDAFPDFKLEILDIVSEGDTAVARWRATGSFTGSGRFLGLLPTGQRMDIEGVDIVRVRDGKIARIDAYTDSAEMGRQLGAMPPRDSAGDRATLAAVNLVTRARTFIQSRR